MPADLMSRRRCHGAWRSASGVKRVHGTHAAGLSYRLIARNVGMSKNTVMEIVRRSVGR